MLFTSYGPELHHMSCTVLLDGHSDSRPVLQPCLWVFVGVKACYTLIHSVTFNMSQILAFNYSSLFIVAADMVEGAGLLAMSK